MLKSWRKFLGRQGAATDPLDCKFVTHKTHSFTCYWRFRGSLSPLKHTTISSVHLCKHKVYLHNSISLLYDVRCSCISLWCLWIPDVLWSGAQVFLPVPCFLQLMPCSTWWTPYPSIRAALILTKPSRQPVPEWLVRVPWMSDPPVASTSGFHQFGLWGENTHVDNVLALVTDHLKPKFPNSLLPYYRGNATAIEAYWTQMLYVKQFAGHAANIRIKMRIDVDKKLFFNFPLTHIAQTKDIPTL